MFGFFKKSPEKIADALLPVANEIGGNLANANPLRIPRETFAYTRFVIGAEVFSNLMCQDLVTSAEPNPVRALGVCRLLAERQIAAVSRSGAGELRVAEIVIWDDELGWLRRCPVHPKLAGADLASVTLPLGDIVRELHPVRCSRMTNDMLKGALVAAQQGPWSLALFMPMCSSLIMQTTADQKKASDNKTVTGLAASLIVQWLLLKASVEQALK
jgi:hypothetical protein